MVKIIKFGSVEHNSGQVVVMISPTTIFSHKDLHSGRHDGSSVRITVEVVVSVVVVFVVVVCVVTVVWVTLLHSPQTPGQRFCIVAATIGCSQNGASFWLHDGSSGREQDTGVSVTVCDVAVVVTVAVLLVLINPVVVVCDTVSVVVVVVVVTRHNTGHCCRIVGPRRVF